MIMPINTQHFVAGFLLAEKWNGVRVPDQVFSPIPFSQGYAGMIK